MALSSVFLLLHLFSLFIIYQDWYCAELGDLCLGLRVTNDTLSLSE